MQHALHQKLQPEVPSAERYRTVRARSAALCAPLAIDDYQVAERAGDQSAQVAPCAPDMVL